VPDSGPVRADVRPLVTGAVRSGAPAIRADRIEPSAATVRSTVRMPCEGDHDMMTPALPQLELSALAQVLFVSPVQPSERPSPAAVRTAIEAQLDACDGNVAACLAVVAQEAGDRPDLYAARMRWAWWSVDVAYLGRLADEDRQPALSPFTARLGARAPLPAGLTG
jgi:hypothetical protein